MKVTKSIMAGLITVGLGGCADTMTRVQDMNWLEIGGTLGGAVVGGYVGSQFGGGFGRTLFMTAGVLMGGSSGYTAARNLDQSDQARYDSTVRQALAQSKDSSTQALPAQTHCGTPIMLLVATYLHSDFFMLRHGCAIASIPVRHRA